MTGVIGDYVAGALAVQSSEHRLTGDQLTGDALGLTDQVAPGGTAVLSTADAAVVAAAFVALDGHAGEVHLLPPGVEISRPGDAVILRAARSEAATERRPPPVPPSVPTTWVLYTSGTTGEPKPVRHTVESLSRTITVRPGPAPVWGLLYDPNRMAGVQVILHALSGAATLIAPDGHQPLAARLATMVDGGVDALSATPSLWRQILQLPVSTGLDLRQITLGGEIADQRVLDALATTYPAARIVHVFASTETAAAFSVRDGREGFPVDYLREPPRGIRLEVRDDVLHVHSPSSSAAGDDGFASTGDIVEIVDDRVLFRGRASGVVNIGGANVWPEAVETILRRHEDVVEAVVSAKANAMVGNVLVARVVLADGAEREGAAKRLRSWVRQQAPTTHVPATVTIEDALTLSSSGKVAR